MNFSWDEECFKLRRDVCGSVRDVEVSDAKN